MSEPAGEWMRMRTKNRPGIVEMGFIGVVSGAVNMLLGKTVGLWVPAPVLIAYLFFYGWLLFHIVHKSAKVPGASLYNPFGVIELHVNNFAKGNRRVFLKLCAATILYAREHNKPVMFCTPLFTAQALRRLFDDAITVYRPSVVERGVAFFAGIAFRVRGRNPLVKGVIDTSRLTPEVLELLHRYADSSK